MSAQFDVSSGRLVIAGCTDYFPDAAHIELPPRSHRARIFYENLNSLSSDLLDEADHYGIVLWRASAEPKILKQRANLEIRG